METDTEGGTTLEIWFNFNKTRRLQENKLLHRLLVQAYEHNVPQMVNLQ